MAGELAELVHELEDLKRAFANFARKGTVHEVKGNRIKLRLGGTDDEPFLSPWIPWTAPAGQFKHRQPPSKGQQMSMISPVGDFGQAFAVPLSFSKKDGFEAPDDSLDTDVLTVGNVKIRTKDDLVETTVGDTKVVQNGAAVTVSRGELSFTLTKDGLTVNAPTVFAEPVQFMKGFAAKGVGGRTQTIDGDVWVNGDVRSKGNVVAEGYIGRGEAGDR
ncbi:hypothetical protein [Microvirga sp. Mcv34]|uniref:hypothetical protein n=1 Tax=Microvirga sp. Mcv34 TaxID=2926016 RepID=UPI0021C968E6|nr:hypothetical protein [Microvirga sp. Mcv34]